MKYVLAPNNLFQRFISPGEVVQFSDRCMTTAKRLTAEEAAEYGVSKLVMVSPPVFDEFTHRRTEVNPVLTNGEWIQQWVLTPLTTEEIINVTEKLVASIIDETQKRLDDFAKTRNYDGIMSACTYATSTNLTFASEGQYCVSMRDATWSTLYMLMSEVQAETRTILKSFSEVEPLLPTLTWPV